MNQAIPMTRAPSAAAPDGRPAAALVQRYGGPTPRYTSYPTAPHFHRGIGAKTYGGWLDALPAKASLSLYLHLPFCDSLCWFCGCHTKVVRRYEPVAAYLEVLLREIDLLAERLSGGQRVTHVHWGGGSPTILTPDDTRRLAERLRRRFGFDPEAEVAVEIDPRGFGDEAVRALAEAGVNRASLGVQDLHPEVQRAVNRIQPFETTRSAVERLRAAGIEDINCDLMYGLPHQDEARLLECVDRILTLEPARIALFGYAHLPRLKRHQRLIPEEALPDGEARLDQFLAAARRLREAGYRQIGLDHFARPGDPLAVAAGAGRLRRNFQGYTPDAADALLGLGASAIGKLPQGFVQNQVPLRQYAEAVGRGRLATARGIVLDDDDRLRGAVIERLMCDLAVDLEPFCPSAETALARFAPELEALAPLEADGLVERHGLRLQVTEAGRPFLRNVAAVFDRYLQARDGRHSQSV